MGTKSINRVQLRGYVGADPEFSYTRNNVAMVTLSLATNENWKDADGKDQERTDWHNCTAFSGLAEIIKQYVHKGSLLLLDGKLQVRTFEGADKQKHRAVTVLIEEVYLSDRAGAAGGHSAGRAQEPAGVKR